MRIQQSQSTQVVAKFVSGTWSQKVLTFRLTGGGEGEAVHRSVADRTLWNLMERTLPPGWLAGPFPSLPLLFSPPTLPLSGWQCRENESCRSCDFDFKCMKSFLVKEYNNKLKFQISWLIYCTKCVLHYFNQKIDSDSAGILLVCLRISAYYSLTLFLNSTQCKLPERVFCSHKISTNTHT